VELIKSFISGYASGIISLLTAPVVLLLFFTFFLLESTYLKRKGLLILLSAIAILSSTILFFSLREYSFISSEVHFDTLGLLRDFGNLFLCIYSGWVLYHRFSGFGKKQAPILFILLLFMSLSFLLSIAEVRNISLVVLSITSKTWNVQISLTFIGALFGTVFSFCILAYIVTPFYSIIRDTQQYKFFKLMVFLIKLPINVKIRYKTLRHTLKKTVSSSFIETIN